MCDTRVLKSSRLFDCLRQLIVDYKQLLPTVSIVGSVVECSPATRAARVRFPDDANSFFPFVQIHKSPIGLFYYKKGTNDFRIRSFDCNKVSKSNLFCLLYL